MIEIAPSMSSDPGAMPVLTQRRPVSFTGARESEDIFAALRAAFPRMDELLRAPEYHEELLSYRNRRWAQKGRVEFGQLLVKIQLKQVFFEGGRKRDCLTPEAPS